MSVAPNAETTELWFLLRDGEWHDARVTRHDLALKVHWGRAFRSTEELRDRAMGGRARVRPITTQEAVDSGRRAIATSTINGARRVGRVEVDPVPTKEIWRGDTPMRIRWVGESLAGFYAEVQKQVEQAETEARNTNEAIRLVHCDHPALPGICAADGRPQPCLTNQILEHGPAVLEDGWDGGQVLNEDATTEVTA